ncbi:HAD family hydrolase [Aeromicrobium duanguangcaii]|uniref:HAD family hydrolase n=1 Tax=Aeromicrobium duanguangcaii TaxID=2968086 RepID=UPI0020177BB6|nr:HAD family hydrolase [Aeromicrobium duanguangcaii]MCL3837951.1 HAD-IB family hydrolase [Aeromicrobium duanguangcaii]
MATAAGRPAAFFDLDKTIIARSSTLAFSKSLFAEGLLSRRSVLRSAYAQLVFSTGGADHDMLEKMREEISKMVTGWDAQTVRQIVREALYEVIEPLVYAEALELIEQHREAGNDVIIVSASGSEMVEPIAQMLGATHAIATRLEEVGGRYSGRILQYCYGPNKVTAMRELAEREGYDLSRSFAYSDSATDVPMLEAVGHPFAVNPDKGLRRRATEEDWPILTFERPTALRSRLLPESTTGKAMALGGLAASASLLALGISAAWRRRTRPEAL